MREHQDLLRTSFQYKKMTDWRCTKGPYYQVGQHVWLSTRDFPQRSECQKLCPWFVGPFPIFKIIIQCLSELNFLDLWRFIPLLIWQRTRGHGRACYIPLCYTFQHFLSLLCFWVDSCAWPRLFWGFFWILIFCLSFWQAKLHTIRPLLFLVQYSSLPNLRQTVCKSTDNCLPCDRESALESKPIFT